MSRKRSRARVGAKLKKARERCGLSLRQIADSTKISLTVLQGLEKDEITHLPGGVLGRGYVRSFASVVKLDPEAVVAEFVAQFPESSVTEGYPPARPDADGAAEVHTFSNPTRIRIDQPSRFSRVASVVAIVMVVAGVMAFAAPRGWAKLETIRTWAMGVPAIRAANPFPRSAQPPTLSSRPVEMLQPSGNLTLPSTRVLPAAASDKARPAASSATSGSDAPGRQTPATVESASTAEPLKMTLSASSASWVIAWVDGRRTISRLMEDGEQETLEAARELVVTAGNGGAIVMTLNESATRALGQSGKTSTVRVNHANLQKHLGRGDPASLRPAQ